MSMTNFSPLPIYLFTSNSMEIFLHQRIQWSALIRLGKEDPCTPPLPSTHTLILITWQLQEDVPETLALKKFGKRQSVFFTTSLFPFLLPCPRKVPKNAILPLFV